MTSPATADLLAQAAEYAAAWLAALPERSLGMPVAAEALRSRLGGALGDSGEDASKVISELVTALEPGLVATAGPRYFGFVASGSLPVAIAADWLVSAFDQNASMYVMSPAAAVAEEVTAEWLLDILGLARGCAVGFVTGGQMANFSCLAAARHSLLAAAGWDVEADGLRGAPAVTVVAGEHAHATVLQAIRLLGLGSANTIRVAADDHGRIRPDELRRTLQQAPGPVLVCAQAGEVNTGAVDPLRQIAGAVAEHGRAWLHVDGAFGLWASASPRLRCLTDGADLADSLTADAHKWLNVPYDCGIAIVRDPAALSAAMRVTAPYLHQSAGRDPFLFTPEVSRRARVLPVYAALRCLGRRGVAELVERCCELAQLAAVELAGCDRIRVLNEVVLNQVLFCIEGADESVTAAVIEKVQQDGTCWLGGTQWRGGPAIRFSVSTWSTTRDDICRSVAAITSAVEQVCG